MVEVRTTSSTGAQKGVKQQAYDKLPALALKDLAILYTKGSFKYAANNWIRGYEFSKSFAGLQRHISLFWSGEDYDIELNTLHAVNAAWHCVTLYTLCHVHPEFDDRVSALGKDITPGMVTNIDKPTAALHTDLEDHFRFPEEIEPRFDLIPNAVLADLAALYGLEVNGVPLIKPLTKGVSWSDVYSRLQEHIWAFWSGEDTDKYNQHHVLYALHYSLLLIELYYRYPEFDDRFTETEGAQPIGFNSDPSK